MLIQFRVENHRSLRDEQTLSFVANEVDPDDPQLIHVPALSERLLPTLALYGANASGKSNVVHALNFMRLAVLHSHRRWEPRGIPSAPFLLGNQEQDPSVYEVQFIVAERRYRYGFALNATQILEEWLELWSDSAYKTLYARNASEYQFSPELPGENKPIAGFTRANSLFLSAAAQNNHMELTPVFDWFHSAQLIVSERSRLGHLDRPLAALFEEQLFSPLNQLLLFDHNSRRKKKRQTVLELVKAADTGILDIRMNDASAIASNRPEGKLLFRHRTESPDREAWLPLSSQSTGTIALLEMIVPLLRALDSGSLLWVDELEASLHPTLAYQLLKLFQVPAQNPHGAQLLFTTHDTNLLGDALGKRPLRRDQVWFAEKHASGATTVYPLSDFVPHDDENLERGYLQGRFGAIPYLGDFSALKVDSRGRCRTWSKSFHRRMGASLLYGRICGPYGPPKKSRIEPDSPPPSPPPGQPMARSE